MAAELSETDVVIAGGGPVGLAAAAELRRRGIDCLVIEPRTTVSHARPRCKTVNVRSMEHLRRWGLAEAFRERAPLPVSWSQDIVFCTSLYGHELSRFRGVLGLGREGDRFPEVGQQAPQYVLEELLRDDVAAQLVSGLRVTMVQQTDDKVVVTAAGADGETRRFAARYALGCDGPRSAVREAIGSAYVGEKALRPNFGMVFRAQGLAPVHGPAVQYWTVNDRAPALMGPIDLHGTWWIITIGVDRETGERAGADLIDGAAGRPLEAEILSTDPWTAHMQIVDRARDGRVFLAGDAAHLNPPFGGHGLNTGLADAVDLGWKLAAAIDGWGGPALLDSYERERRPVQARVIAAAEANNRVLATELFAERLDDDGPDGDRARALAHTAIQEAKHAEFHALDLVLDLVHEDSPVVAPGAGGRLPHAWLDDGRSLYDALGSGMTLLVLGDGLEPEALARAARERRVPLTVLRIDEPAVRARAGGGLVLVRPDQHIAWRDDRSPGDPEAVIDRIRGAA
jgi:2-polyprenyl-6-methoxyphenol hydroxylase-like FAD-dependent oxidoreductase